MKSINTHNNFYFFTASLVLLLFVSALASSSRHGDNPHLLQGLILMTELVAYFSLSLSKKWRHFIFVSLLLMIVANLLRQFTDWSIAPLTALVVSLLFYCGMAWVAGKQVLSSGGIELNQVVGTVALYLLLGIIWALLYLIALEFWPTGIHGIEYKKWDDNFGVAAYFSYVTMATLGYGDITPTAPVPRTLAYLQAITGTFYLAVVVAGMVGAFSKKPR